MYPSERKQINKCTEYTEDARQNKVKDGLREGTNYGRNVIQILLYTSSHTGRSFLYTYYRSHNIRKNIIQNNTSQEDIVIIIRYTRTWNLIPYNL